jgi:hypothetical protein
MPSVFLIVILNNTTNDLILQDGIRQIIQRHSQKLYLEEVVYPPNDCTNNNTVNPKKKGYTHHAQR